MVRKKQRVEEREFRQARRTERARERERQREGGGLDNIRGKGKDW